jgi:hypothetical protein
MPKRPKFRFLTMEEFSKLSRAEKIAYLAAAVAEIDAERGEVPEHILFVEVERRKKPRKLSSNGK